MADSRIDMNPAVNAGKLTLALNAPTIFDFVEEASSGNASYAASDRVTFSDPDLGAIFDGRVVDVKSKEGPNADEETTYQAIDLGRSLLKQPARLMCNYAGIQPPYSDPPNTLGTTKIHFYEGTKIFDAISFIVESIGPNGIGLMTAFTVEPAIGNLALTKPIDKGGATIAEWLDDILTQTNGGVWYTTGTELFIIDYYRQPDVEIIKGTYGADSPIDKAFLVSAEVGETSNDKFRAVVCEGAGKFRRVKTVGLNLKFPSMDNSVPPVRTPGLCAQRGDNGQTGGGVWQPAANQLFPGSPIWAGGYLFAFRFYFPDSVIVSQYYGTSLNCNPGAQAAGAAFRYQVGWTDGDFGSPAPHLQSGEDGFAYIQQDRDDVAFDTVESPNLLKGAYYISFLVGTASDISQRPGQPNFYYMNARYTAYEGPLIGKHESSDMRLLNEGEKIIQCPQWFKYHQDVTHIVGGDNPVIEIAVDHDDTELLQAYADLLGPRFADGPHVTGKVTVHLPNAGGPVKNIRPGMSISAYANHSVLQPRPWVDTASYRLGDTVSYAATVGAGSQAYACIKIPNVGFHPDIDITHWRPTQLGGGLPRIQSVVYDLQTRNAELTISTVPLRDWVRDEKWKAAQKRVVSEGWTQRPMTDCIKNCMSDMVLDSGCRPVFIVNYACGDGSVDTLVTVS